MVFKKDEWGKEIKQYTEEKVSVTKVQTMAGRNENRDWVGWKGGGRWP